MTSSDYTYHPPGNYGGRPSTVEERRAAFDNAPACHHPHPERRIADEAEAFLAALAAEAGNDSEADRE